MRGKRKVLKKEKSAMSLSLYGNLFFVAVELGMAVYTGSQAVLLDAVYDGIEFLMLLPSVLLIPLLYRPSTEKRPFGYMQIETVFLVIKGITMTAATIGLIGSNVNMLLHGGQSIAFDTVAWFELFACGLGVAVYLLLRRKNRSLNSPLITAEMDGWRIDSAVSLGMAAAFFLPAAVPMGALAPYLDQIITVVLSVIMLPTPIRTVVSALRDLLLLPPEEETLQEIREIVEEALVGYRYSEIQHEVVKTGRKLWISTYITPEADEMSLERFQQAQARCIEALSRRFADFYFELLPHVAFRREEAGAAQ